MYLESKSVWKQFTESRGRGVILLAYSAVLSRGLRETRDDIASVLGETPQMMGRHDYASQELVNLLLVGGAFSQVFDGEKRLEGQSKEDTVLLRGIPKRSRIGFLTLFEHYGFVPVGNRLKSPPVPIWVVCSESHYSVLFSDVNRGVRTAEGGVSTGGGMDMTKYLSGSYYRLYTLQPPQRQRMRVDRKYHVDRR